MIDVSEVMADTVTYGACKHAPYAYLNDRRSLALPGLCLLLQPMVRASTHPTPEY